ncbi:MAG: copper-binding protein [Acidobacteriaceae bacterium]|nr:copper-binding protein [Acidobacteriaceae bacterium]
MHRTLTLVLFAAALTSCLRKPESAKPRHHYPLTGLIVAVNFKDRTVTVDAAAIPHFMEAMTMEYPVQSGIDLNRLHVGDKISATVNVSPDGLYDLSNVERQSSAASK